MLLMKNRHFWWFIHRLVESLFLMLKSPFWILKSVCVMRNCQFLLDKHPRGTADFVRLLRVLGGLWKLVRGILNAAYTLIWTCLGVWRMFGWMKFPVFLDTFSWALMMGVCEWIVTDRVELRWVLLAVVIYIFSIVSTRLIGHAHRGAKSESFLVCYNLSQVATKGLPSWF